MKFGPVTGAVLALAVGVGLRPIWGVVCTGELVLGVWTLSLVVRRFVMVLSTSGLIAVVAGIAGVALAIGMARAAWDIQQVTSVLALFVAHVAAVGGILLGVGEVGLQVGANRTMYGRSRGVYRADAGTGMACGLMVKTEYNAIEADLSREV